MRSHKVTLHPMPLTAVELVRRVVQEAIERFGEVPFPVYLEHHDYQRWLSATGNAISYAYRDANGHTRVVSVQSLLPHTEPLPEIRYTTESDASA